MSGWATAHIETQHPEKLKEAIENEYNSNQARTTRNGDVEAYSPGYEGNLVIKEAMKEVGYKEAVILEANDTTDSGKATVFKNGEKIDEFEGYEGARGADAAGMANNEYNLRPPTGRIK